jgi:septal ring factor EnvC (AmiA/AmiB activator)
MTRDLVVLVTVFALSGCASWPVLLGRSGPRLAEADAFAVRGEYAQALVVYEEVLARPPSRSVAARAEAGRAAMKAVLAARTDATRWSAEANARQTAAGRLQSDLTSREAEVSRLTRELAAREAELARLRQELTARQSDIARLTLEAERLRGDLEQLMRIEMRLERRRP